MHVVVVYANKEDKIELTKKELEKMLDDAYKAGKDDAVTHYSYPVTITTPSNPLGSVYYTPEKVVDPYTRITCSTANNSEVRS